MNNRRLAIAITIIFIISACNLPGVTGNTPDSAATAGALETSIAQMVALTMGASVSNIPEITQTPSDTPQPTASNTPSVPMVSVSVETNCRSGPGPAYNILGILPVGSSAEVVGRNSTGDTWVIKLPSNPAITCWLWGQYATVIGNTQALPVVPNPPTPTPAAAFTVSYDGMITCMGEYAFRFRITNPGSITWESVQVIATDTVTSTSKTHTSDSFVERSGCPKDNELLNLEPGEPGVVTTAIPGQFVYDPSGHAMSAEIKLCSQNGFAGTCLTKSVSFTP